MVVCGQDDRAGKIIRKPSPSRFGSWEILESSTQYTLISASEKEYPMMVGVSVICNGAPLPLSETKRTRLDLLISDRKFYVDTSHRHV